MFRRLIPIRSSILSYARPSSSSSSSSPPTMSQASSDTATTSGPKNHPFSRGNVGPPLRTFTDAAAAPAAHVRILPALAHDHRELGSHSRRIMNSTDADEQTRFQNQFTWELARHAIGEELVIYPAIAKHVKDGQHIADKDRDEHQSIKEQLKAFQSLSPGDPRFIPTLQAMMDDMERHFQQEESADFVLLEEALSQADSEALTRSFERTKMFVPSRSHPMTPDKPPFETVVGLLTAPMDKVADIFRRWPHTSESEQKAKQ